MDEAAMVNHDACAGTAQPLDGAELRRRLEELPDWSTQDGRLHRDTTFDGFEDAIEFALAVAALAIRRNHHPRFCVDKRTVTLTLWTRKMDAVTALDAELAADIDALLEARGR
jgi:4a-hydroxytetrahydrobiopterin dehydratase